LGGVLGSGLLWQAGLQILRAYLIESVRRLVSRCAKRRQIASGERGHAKGKTAPDRTGGR